MMKNHKGVQGHSLSGPGNQTGACPRCGLLNGAHAERCPTLNAGLGEKDRKSKVLPTQIEGEVPCPKCGRELQHRPYCPIYIAQQMRKPSTEADDRTRAELAQHVADSVAPCPHCLEVGLHKITCPRWTLPGSEVEQRIGRIARAPGKQPDPEEEGVEVIDSKKLVVQFIEHKTKERILEMHLDYEMTGILPVRGDFISPFGLQDPRAYKVLMRHSIMDQQPVMHIYLEKI